MKNNPTRLSIRLELENTMHPDEQSPGNSSFRRPEFPIWLGLVALVFSLVALTMLSAAAGTRPVTAFQRQTPTPTPTSTQIVAIGSDPDLTIVLPEVPSPTPTQGPVDGGSGVYSANAYTPTPTPQRLRLDPTPTSNVSLQEGNQGPPVLSTASILAPDSGSKDKEFGTLTITARACPEKVELDPGSTSLDELARLCREPLSGTGIEVLASGQAFARDETDQAGQIRFERVPVGDIAIVQHPPEGYGEGLLSCAADEEWQIGEERPDTPLPPISNDPGFDPSKQTMSPGLLVCFVFIPETLTVPAGAIVIENYWCPGGLPTDNTYFPLTYVSQVCVDSGPTAAFELNGVGSGGAFWPIKSTNGSSGGSVGWQSLEPGDGPYIISGYGFNPYRSAKVYCREVPELAATTSTAGHMSMLVTSTKTEDSIQVWVQSDHLWQCKWFNFPASGNAPPGGKP